MFDDPGIPSALTPWARFWLDPWEDRVRWTLCAREVCFKNELLRWGRWTLWVREVCFNNELLREGRWTLCAGVACFKDELLRGGRRTLCVQVVCFKYGLLWLIQGRGAAQACICILCECMCERVCTCADRA